MKMKQKTKLIISLSIALLIVLLMTVMIVILIKTGRSGRMDDVHTFLTVEAGSEPDLNDFLKNKSLTLTLDENSTYNTARPGDYRLLLRLSNGKEAEVTLHVADTTPPSVKKAPPMLLALGSLPKAEDLLPKAYIEDYTEVRVSFLSERADTTSVGRGSVSLRLEDEGGNVTKAEVSFYVTDRLNSEYYHEIGAGMPEAEALLPGCSAVFTNESALSVSEPGKVVADVRVFGSDYLVSFEAKDTFPPVAQAREDLRFYVGDLLPEDPAALFVYINDATAVSARYADNYKLDRAVKKTVNVILTDAGGNETKVEVFVQVFDKGEGADTEPPVFSGIHDFTVVPGSAPDYLEGVSVYDGRDGEIPRENVRVDASAVKIHVPTSGQGYPVIYTATDSSGNRATATAYVYVVRDEIDREEMEKTFASVIASLNAEGRSRFTVMGRVYDLITTKYVLKDGPANSSEGDYEVEAYLGFTTGRGSDETYLAMTRVLLDRLGVEYMIARRADNGRAHAWLLADYGIGWLYIDCAPIPGYVWSKQGELLPEDSKEAKALSSLDMKKREAMTDGDLAALTALSNGRVPGWNYYLKDESGALLPPTAERTESGGYIAAKYEVTYKAGTGGSLTGQTLQTVVHGSKTSSVTAIARAGYRFVRWDDGVTDETRRDTVNKNAVYTALFELDDQAFTFYTVRYEAGQGGSVQGETEQSALYGKTASKVVAVPDDGYYFISWSDGSTDPERSDRVTGEAVYTATFGRLVKISYEASAGGHVEEETLQRIIPGTTGAPVIALPDRGYVFAGWSDGVTEAVRRDSAAEDLTVTALFEMDTSEYTVRYEAEEGGMILGKTEQTARCGETTSVVTAQPDEGMVFVKWSDGKTDAKRSDVIFENAVYTAEFAAASETHTLTYLSSNGGSVTGQTVQSLESGAEGSAVTATANEGYRFVSWSDGKEEPTRTDRATQDLTLTAVFEEIP